MVERPLMERWVVGSILHCGPIELFLDWCKKNIIIIKAVASVILSVGWCI